MYHTRTRLQYHQIHYLFSLYLLQGWNPNSTSFAFTTRDTESARQPPLVLYIYLRGLITYMNSSSSCVLHLLVPNSPQHMCQRWLQCSNAYPQYVSKVVTMLIYSPQHVCEGGHYGAIFNLYSSQYHKATQKNKP